MDKTAIDYADFAEYDRRQRRIERHVLAAFLGGLVVGLTGMLLSGIGPAWLDRVYDPYAYFALALVVGASASGWGWALLTTFLAAVSTLVAAMGASALRGRMTFDVIGGSAAGLNLMLGMLVGLGVLAYVTRRQDRWGDIAAGVVGGVLLADVVDRATPGFIDSEATFWPGPALFIGSLSVGLVFALRRTAGGRMRALAVTALLAGLFVIVLAESLGTWFPLVP
ncbi:hypothetical protein [Nonomuraea lactucae]|uniref:hypothetical protein n=1 Tax=Nonomuraea lactucae TaxID=2249762 RepID=UPI0013B44814|nr:hypothetical protein [Nonomuraea lactucae]